MDAITGNNLIITLIVLVAAMELVTLTGKTMATIREWRKPSLTMEERVDVHEQKLANDHKRINDLEAGQRAVCMGIKALLSHGINGNSRDKLVEAQADIDKYLINR